MKVTFDTKTGECKVGKKIYGTTLEVYKQDEINSFLRKFLNKNTKLTDYEHDNMWMSYRYCIGRHTIASHMHATDIWKNCANRLSYDRSIFNAFDMNREIEQCLSFIKPNFHFPLTSLNRIYTSAIDIFCEFLEDYNIQSKEDLLKYKDVNIILTDNERGYKFETITWEEWLRPKIFEFWKKDFYDQEFTEDDTWNDFLEWKKHDWKEFNLSRNEFYKEITKDIPNPEHYWLYDIEDLFIWNDLVHLFDKEHYHKSVLLDGSEVTWVWSWTHKFDKDGKRMFGYEKIRIDVDKWNGHTITNIPDKNIINNLY